MKTISKINFNKYFFTLQKGPQNVKVKNDTQLHHRSELLTTLKVNVKRLNELRCPRSDHRSWHNVEKSNLLLLYKRVKNGQGKNNRYCAQLHHPTNCLSKAIVKRLNE